MTSAPRDNSREESISPQENSATMSHVLEDSVGHMGRLGNPSLGLHNKGKRCRPIYFAGFRANRSNPRSPRAAAVIRRAKGNWVQKAGPFDTLLPLAEQTTVNSLQEGRDQEMKPCMFTCGHFQHCPDDIHCLLKIQMMMQP